MNSSSSQISIFEYVDYRRFLRDWYEHAKANRDAVSFRFLSRAAGFSSPNFLKLVMDGKRNLSSESIEKFARALKLNKEETSFFRALVQFGQARTSEEKRAHAEQLLRSRPYQKLHPLHGAQFSYYTHWYVVAVRELVDTVGFREDPAWIARQLKPEITPTEARRALETLLELKLVERDLSGTLKQSQALLNTADEVTSASVGEFHHEMIRRADESLERFPARLREISCVTMSLSPEGFEEAKQLLQKFRKELLELAGRDRGQTGVFQFNLQLFPLSEIRERGAK